MLVAQRLQGKQVLHVAAGSHHTICTTTDGSVFTWGHGYGRLGLGDDLSDRLVPALVRGELQNNSMVKIAAGKHHSACVVEDGSVYTWGQNDDDQSGLPVLLQASDLNAL